MAHLHELLAAEKDIVGKATKIINEGRETFSKRQDHFTGFVKRYEAILEELKVKEEEQTERRELVTTVYEKLEYVLDAVKDVIDARYQKDMTNLQAKADIVLDGVILASNVPAITLLALEDMLHNVRGVFDAIPTLEPGTKWVAADDIRPNAKKAEHDDVKISTKKITKHNVVVPATDRHPAQVQPETYDIPAAKIITTNYSGRISPTEKMLLMNRLEKLAIAVKKARARANEAQVVEASIAADLLAALLPRVA